MPVKSTSEASLTFSLARFMKYHYPGVLFHFDFGSGAVLLRGQAAQQRRLNGRAWPDLFIAQPRGGAAGLFLELKKAGARKTVDGGRLVTSAHIREQLQKLQQLRAAGYRAEIAVGLGAAEAIITEYLGPGVEKFPGERDKMF